MKIRMNLDEINEGFSPIPEGDYEAYVYDIERTKFTTGSEGFKITYNIADGPYQGRKIFDNIVLTEAAQWKLGQFYKAVTGASGVVDIDISTIPSFVGKRVLLSVKVEEQTYNGKTNERNVVRGVSFLGGQVPVGASLTDTLNERDGVVDTEDGLPF